MFTSGYHSSTWFIQPQSLVRGSKEHTVWNNLVPKIKIYTEFLFHRHRDVVSNDFLQHRWFIILTMRMEIHRLILSAWANGAYSLFGTNIELCRSTSNGNTWSKRTTKAAIPLHLRNFRCSEAPTSPKYPLHFRDIFGTSDKSLGILLEQYQNMSKISEQSPESSLVLDHEPWLNCKAFTEIAPSRAVVTQKSD